MMSGSDLSHLPPRLAEVVREVRERAKATGELDVPTGPRSAGLSPEGREAVARWIRDGGYEEAVAAVIAEDPELANE